MALNSSFCRSNSSRRLAASAFIRAPRPPSKSRLGRKFFVTSVHQPLGVWEWSWWGMVWLFKFNYYIHIAFISKNLDALRPKRPSSWPPAVPFDGAALLSTAPVLPLASHQWLLGITASMRKRNRAPRMQHSSSEFWVSRSSKLEGALEFIESLHPNRIWMIRTKQGDQPKTEDSELCSFSFWACSSCLARWFSISFQYANKCICFKRRKPKVHSSWNSRPKFLRCLNRASSFNSMTIATCHQCVEKMLTTIVCNLFATAICLPISLSQ